MFEVEKKFSLGVDQVERIVDVSEYKGEKKFTDTYFDDDNFSLTRRDIWLRERSGKYELKLPINASGFGFNTYEEEENEDEICKSLGLEQIGILSETLEKAGIKPFCTIKTERRSFLKDSIRIDVDVTDFGYSLVEFEILAQSESQIKEAEEKILHLAKIFGLREGNVRGKVIEYLKRNSPSHYQALIESGTVVE